MLELLHDQLELLAPALDLVLALAPLADVPAHEHPGALVSLPVDGLRDRDLRGEGGPLERAAVELAGEPALPAEQIQERRGVPILREPEHGFDPSPAKLVQGIAQRAARGGIRVRNLAVQIEAHEHLVRAPHVRGEELVARLELDPLQALRELRGQPADQGHVVRAESPRGGGEALEHTRGLPLLEKGHGADVGTRGVGIQLHLRVLGEAPDRREREGTAVAVPTKERPL